VSILGTRVVRTEDQNFLTRGATYTEDLVEPALVGALHATFVRSPIAHARIESIDASAALELPGVIAVLTAADFASMQPQKPALPMYPESMGQPLLADGVVRHVGEAVALVLTEDRYAGEDAAELVSVDYDPLPVVVDPRAAATNEVLLFPAAGTNVAMTNGRELDPHFFDECDVVVTHEVLNQRVAVAPLEVRAAAAVWGEDGRLTFWRRGPSPRWPARSRCPRSRSD
jgi:carbon-monoxide dehydrogenase large subunit